MKLSKLVVFLVLVAPGISFACSFDTDCSVGSKCIKGMGQIYGYCAGGLNPGNDNDRVPVTDPLDPNGTAGNTCSFDTDCGPTSKCLKEPGFIKGVCIRKQW